MWRLLATSDYHDRCKDQGRSVVVGAEDWARMSISGTERVSSSSGRSRRPRDPGNVVRWPETTAQRLRTKLGEQMAHAAHRSRRLECPDGDTPAPARLAAAPVATAVLTAAPGCATRLSSALCVASSACSRTSSSRIASMAATASAASPAAGERAAPPIAAALPSVEF